MGGDGLGSMSVSCHAAGDCVAVGTADDFSLRNGTGLQWIESGGHWRGATIVKAPSDATTRPINSRLFALSCSATKSCMSVGFAVRHGSGTMQVALTDGKWGRGSWVRDAYRLYGVSCTSSHCVAVGQYDATFGSLVMSDRSGKAFGDPVHIRLPANAVPNGHTGSQLNGMTAVSCLGKTWCLAVGEYTIASPEGYRAMVTTS